MFDSKAQSMFKTAGIKGVLKRDVDTKTDSKHSVSRSHIIDSLPSSSALQDECKFSPL